MNTLTLSQFAKYFDAKVHEILMLGLEGRIDMFEDFEGQLIIFDMPVEQAEAAQQRLEEYRKGHHADTRN